MEAAPSSRYLPSSPEFLLEYFDGIPRDDSDDYFDGYVSEQDNIIYDQEASFHITSSGTLFTSSPTPHEEVGDTPLMKSPVVESETQPTPSKLHSSYSFPNTHKIF